MHGIRLPPLIGVAITIVVVLVSATVGVVSMVEHLHERISVLEYTLVERLDHSEEWLSNEHQAAQREIADLNNQAAYQRGLHHGMHLREQEVEENVSRPD